MKTETNGSGDAGRLLAPVPVSCHVRMFKPQFAPLVEAGTKCQTVRPTPKRMPKPGDRISLRTWAGKPYRSRSKHRVLREATISEVSPCSIYENAVYVNGIPEHRECFAVADGFADYGELAEWFKTTHGLPFDGVVLKWHND